MTDLEDGDGAEGNVIVAADLLHVQVPQDSPEDDVEKLATACIKVLPVTAFRVFLTIF